MDANELQELKNTRYDQLDIKSLPDLSSIIIDTSVPITERMQKFYESIKNPYFHRVNDTIVELTFSEEKGTIENKVKDYLKGAKSQ